MSTPRNIRRAAEAWNAYTGGSRPTLYLNLTVQQHHEQSALFNPPPARVEPEVSCPHAGTGRDYQRGLGGELDVVCSECGDVVDTYYPPDEVNS